MPLFIPRDDNTFDLYQDGVDIGRTTAWFQQVTLPANIAELTGGFPCRITEISCVITLKSGTARLFSIPPSFSLAASPDGLGKYANSLSVGIRPQLGNYSQTSNGIGSGNSDGALVFNSASGLFIVSSQLPTYLSTTLASPMTGTQTTMTIGAAIFQNDTYVKIDDEIVYITSGGSGATPTIVRGQLGTTPATHLQNTIVSANIAGGTGPITALLARTCITFKRII